MDDAFPLARRTLLGAAAGVGTASVVGCIGQSGDEDPSGLALEDGAELPPLFDCNAWIGEPADGTVSARLHRPADGRGLDSVEELIGEMDRMGIDLSLVYDVTARTENSHAGNDRLLDTISAYPRLGPTWVGSPEIVDEHGSAEAFVDAMNDANVLGLRLFPGEIDVHDYLLTDPSIEPVLDALAADSGLLILDALSGVVQDGFTYQDLGDVCERYEPDGLSVILTNLWPTMGPFGAMSGMVETVERVDNLYVDTARFQTFDGLRLFADRVGIDRLVFGTHLPHASAGAGLATIMLAGLTEEERRQVGGENLAGLLGDGTEHLSEGDGAPEEHFKTPPYGLIDMHGHVQADSSQDRFPDADGLVATMDRTGIDFALVSSLSGKNGNDIAARAGERYPDRLLPVALANPNWRTLPYELKRAFDQLGCEAIKIHPYSHNTPPDDPAYDPVWEFANEREALIVAHWGGSENEREAWIERASTNDDATLMLYHAGRSWNTADNFVAVAEARENVFLEITYSYNVDGIIEYLIEQAGPEQVFWGTDLGARAPESQVGWATYARISDEERWLHMRENARRLLDDLDLLPAAYQDE